MRQQNCKVEIADFQIGKFEIFDKQFPVNTHFTDTAL